MRARWIRPGRASATRSDATRRRSDGRAIVRARGSEGVRSPTRNRPSGRDDLAEDAAVDVGEAVVAAAVAEGQALVVEAELVQDRGVDVVDRDGVLDDG